jgi:hypothetical protein
VKQRLVCRACGYVVPDRQPFPLRCKRCACTIFDWKDWENPVERLQRMQEAQERARRSLGWRLGRFLGGVFVHGVYILAALAALAVLAVMLGAIWWLAGGCA